MADPGLGLIQAFLEADSPRVGCAEHGVVATQVSWARHGAGHTYAFDDTAAWLVTHCSKSAVRDLLRIAWRTVGSIVTRVVDDAEAKTDRFANLRRIGIDEFRYKRGHKYLTVVVDHDTGVLLWAHPGRDQKTLEKFFDRLGEERCAQITLVSADAAEWIANVIADRCTNAELCLSDRQAATLAGIAKTNAPLFRAYLLKEQLRQVFQLKGAEGIALLDAWLKWAWRCRLPAFVKLARSIRDYRAGIDAALTHGLSNARVESVNYETAAAHPHRLRVPLTRSTHRFSHARPRWTVPPYPAAPQPEHTHGKVTRARKVKLVQ